MSNELKAGENKELKASTDKELKASTNKEYNTQPLRSGEHRSPQKNIIQTRKKFNECTF